MRSFIVFLFSSILLTACSKTSWKPNFEVALKIEQPIELLKNKVSQHIEIAVKGEMVEAIHAFQITTLEAITQDSLAKTPKFSSFFRDKPYFNDDFQLNYNRLRPFFWDEGIRKGLIEEGIFRLPLQLIKQQGVPIPEIAQVKADLTLLVATPKNGCLEQVSNLLKQKDWTPTTFEAEGGYIGLSDNQESMFGKLQEGEYALNIDLKKSSQKTLADIYFTNEKGQHIRVSGVNGGKYTGLKKRETMGFAFREQPNNKWTLYMVFQRPHCLDTHALLSN